MGGVRQEEGGGWRWDGTPCKAPRVSLWAWYGMVTHVRVRVESWETDVASSVPTSEEINLSGRSGLAFPGICLSAGHLWLSWTPLAKPQG